MVAPQALPQFVNPQHTESLFNEGQLDHCFSTPRMTQNLPSPFIPTPPSLSTNGHLDMSDVSRSFGSQPSSASSVRSSSAIITPTSSNSSSRRHSLISPPDSQQYFLLGPQASPTPATRNQQVLVAGQDLFNRVDVHGHGKSGLEWQYSGPSGSLPSTSSYDNCSMDVQDCLTMDLAAGFDSSMSNMLTDRQDLEGPLISAFSTAPSRCRPALRYQPPMVTTNIAPTMLEAPFEPSIPSPEQSPRIWSPESDYALPRKPKQTVTGPQRCRKHSKRSPKAEKLRGRAQEKLHPCSYCTLAFKRPEHLKRHAKSHKPGKMLDCPYEEYGCQQKIKDREDNLNAHLLTTHFKYGKTERGGKRARYSMRSTVEAGLRSRDPRWKFLLEGKIEFGDTETRYYKMLGYTIKDTQELRVRDVVDDWEGSEEILLKEYDPRWKKLLEGTMTFEQAMERGVWMHETEAEGVLGVDMATTKEMGLQSLDPRWKKLLEGNMTYEVADKLGVVEENIAQKAKLATA